MIKDVVALVDGSTGDDVPLGHAERIALEFDANLTTLYLNVLPEILTSGRSAISPIALDQVLATSKAVGAAAAARLAARVEGLSVPGEFRHMDAPGGDLWNLVSDASRAADLFVARHPSGRGVRREWRLVAEAALLGSARGVYFAERPAEPGPIHRSVIVAWDNSRSATRAVTEALPFLKKAQQTLIVTVDGSRTLEPQDLRQDLDLVRHLARVGVSATYKRVKALGRSVSHALAEEISGVGADLLVMGAYGHSRIRERIFGGVTRDFLAHSPVPVLMAH